MPITPLHFEAVETALQLVLSEQRPPLNSKDYQGMERFMPDVRGALNQLFFEDGYEVDPEALAENLCDANR